MVLWLMKISLDQRVFLYAGDLQFMTAGKGVVHSEMPVANADGSPTVGLQLWVDLPNNMKGVKPRYRDLRGKSQKLLQMTVKLPSRSYLVDHMELNQSKNWLTPLSITITTRSKPVVNLNKNYNQDSTISCMC